MSSAALNSSCDALNKANCPAVRFGKGLPAAAPPLTPGSLAAGGAAQITVEKAQMMPTTDNGRAKRKRNMSLVPLKLSRIWYEAQDATCVVCNVHDPLPLGNTPESCQKI
jgi:hypothetical protein